jgi:LysM repeat protein
MLFRDKSDSYFDYYEINKGDTLYAIAKSYNLNPTLLASLNGLDINDYIYPEQILLIPNGNYSYYITKGGDTLESVADTLGVNQEKLLNDNKVIYLLSGQLIVKRKN